LIEQSTNHIKLILHMPKETRKKSNFKKFITNLEMEENIEY